MAKPLVEISGVVDMAVVPKILKKKLSEYVRCAAAGEAIVVTDRGRAVAEIGPPRSEPDAYYDNPELIEAVRQGWIKPGARRGGTPPPRLPALATLEQLLQELDRDLEDR